MFKKELTLQEYLSLGYIYLIVLGVLSDVIYYGILGFPIVQYMSILDALISPISLLTVSWKSTLILIAFIVLLYLYIIKLSPRIYKGLRNKKWYRKIYNVEKWDKIYAKVENKKNFTGILAIVFFYLFLTFRLGIAIGTQRQLNTGVKLNYEITFKDDQKLNVRKIGQNSTYIFYVEKGENVITATPILDNIKQLKRIKDE